MGKDMIGKIKCLFGRHDSHWRSSVNEKRPSGYVCSRCDKVQR